MNKLTPKGLPGRVYQARHTNTSANRTGDFKLKMPAKPLETFTPEEDRPRNKLRPEDQRKYRTGGHKLEIPETPAYVPEYKPSTAYVLKQAKSPCCTPRSERAVFVLRSTYRPHGPRSARVYGNNQSTRQRNNPALGLEMSPRQRELITTKTAVVLSGCWHPLT